MVLSKKLFNRVLVIDDDPASLFLARVTVHDSSLAEEIATYQTAKEGLDFIKVHCMDEHTAPEDCPDLVLLDINMPGMDGFDFLEALQLLGQKHLIRKVVVVLTSSSNPRDQDKMQTLGVRGFITKPITEEKITRLVARGA